jgi:hypothetical protein
MNRGTRLRDRAGGVVLLAILLGTSGLLIAGYGLPVGLGWLAGLFLGFLGGLFAWLWTLQGRGQVTFGGATGSSSNAWLSADPDTARAQLHELTEVLPVDIGRVRGIVPVLASAKAGGLAIELVDAELCEAGLGFNVDVHILPGTLPPPWLARVSIEDDSGTAYRASAQGQGSGPPRLRIRIVAIPLPPASATKLTLRIEEFLDPFPGRGRALPGPWTFEIPLVGSMA